MKNTSKAILLILILCIGVLFYYLNKTPSDQVQQPAVIDIKPKDMADQNAVKTINAGQESIDLGAVSDESAISFFESAVDSGETLKLIERLFDNGKDALAKTLLDELHQRCGHKAHFQPTPDTPTWVFEKVMKYCENYDSSSYNNLLSEGVHFKAENPDVLSLTSSDEVDIDKLSQDFLDMLTQMNYSPSHFMIDVSDTINYFSGELRIDLNLGQSDNINSFDVGTVQNIAVELYACQKFGGCGPDSNQALSYCFIDRSCLEGWSLMDYYQNTLSQVNYNEVMNILNFIRRYERLNNP